VTGAVEVVNRTRAAIDAAAVAAVVDVVLAAEGAAGAEVGVTFVGERRIRDLNREHRGRDQVTDVLSFPLEDPDDMESEARRRAAGGRGKAGGADEVVGAEGDAPSDGPPRLLGDIVVCARQALRQARASGLPAGVELAVLLVHGTLHLLGYHHETDAGAMALRQAELLERVRWEELVDAAQ
jgi:probable rRNA maturation factor